MTQKSTRLSVTPMGRVVAQSVLHPLSAHELLRFSSDQCSNLLDLMEDDQEEQKLFFIFLHAAFSSPEYEARTGERILPYQLNPLIPNPLADQAEPYLIESPWRRNCKAANAALIALRWSQGEARNKLAVEFETIGSGILQAMFREISEILFSWADVINAATSPNISDADRPQFLIDNIDLLRALRNLSSSIRAFAKLVYAGLPGDVQWIRNLVSEDTGQPLFPREAILRFRKADIVLPEHFLERGKSNIILDILKDLGIVDLNDAMITLRREAPKYKDKNRRDLWKSCLFYAAEEARPIFEKTIDSRGKDFEVQIENLLDLVGLSYTRLDDGRTPGAADLHIGLNHAAQVVVELKSSEKSVSLNSATDVIKGAAIVGLDHLPKLTIANPGFEPNVSWQARNIRDLALVEACDFCYGLALLSSNKIDKDSFLDWVSQPGILSAKSLPLPRAVFGK